ncbi:MAG: hypothetical protein F4Y50_08265 [Dehalococcoidia bacterium]|nr:hypothetical protein [Dehalococcoidia bacterium]
MKKRQKKEFKVVSAPGEGQESYTHLTPEQEELRLEGLRILARMIVRAHLRGELDSKSKTEELQQQEEDRPDSEGRKR